MRALITGACGFAGGHLVKHLLECGDTVLATVHRRPEIGLGCETASLDVTKYADCVKVVADFKPEVIYHLAGIAFVPEAEDNFDRALQINVGTVNNIFRACHLQELRTGIVLASSAEAYGRIQQSDLPLRETLALRPSQNYSLSKAMAEMVAARYHQYGFARAIVMRPFNHIGPGQDRRFVASNFAHQMASITRGRCEPKLLVGNLDARRDFSDVRDIVRAYRLAALRLSMSFSSPELVRIPDVFNLGGGRAVPVQEILDTLIAVSGLSLTVEKDPSRMRASEVPEVYGSIERAQQVLGWVPQISLRTSLEDTYRYWLDRV